MKLFYSNILSFFLILLMNNCYSQNEQNADSLLNVISNTKDDRIKVELFNLLFLEYEYKNVEKASFYLKEAFEISSKLNFKAGIALTYYHMAYLEEDNGNYSKAIEYYSYSLEIRKDLKDKKGIADIYSCLGIIFDNQGNYPEALKNHFNALKMYEELQDKEGVGNCYNNIGVIYENQHNYSEALKYHLASLKIEQEKGDHEGIANSYINVGIINEKQGDYAESLKMYHAALKIMEEIDNKRSMAHAYNNIGVVYNDLGEYSESLKNHLSALEIRNSINDKAGVSSSYCNIGYVLIKLKRFKDAEVYLDKAIKQATAIGFKDILKFAFQYMAILDSTKGNYKGAYENHKLYILYRDSLDNEETRKKTVQTQMTYEFEKKEAVAIAEHKKELENQKLIAEERSRKQILIIVFVVSGFFLVLVFAGFIYRSLRLTRKQKEIIEKQKLMVEEKNILLNQQNEEIRTQRDEIEAQRDEIEAQRDLVTIQKEEIEEIHKEVTDSINYAKRIQEALLPVSDSARSVLGEHFILFKPKNIVSGDFYWTTKINNLLFVSVADCTGHGVPGAFMSMLGISFLNEIVQKQEINKANQILNQLRTEIIHALQQKGVHGEQKDGMDISLLVLNTETNEAQWAGANNPLYIIKKSPVSLSQRPEYVEGGVEDKRVNTSTEPALSNANVLSVTDELIELKGDKMPIAIYPVMNDFTNHEFSLQKGDSVFLFTDGYADQFGGTKGRKFMYKQLKELLVNNSCMPMFYQKDLLQNTIEKWMIGFEQIDDVTIIGIKI